MNPILETTQNHSGHPHEEIGYQMAHTDKAIEKGLLKALALLKKMKWSGAETRMWTAHIEIDTQQKMDGIKYPEQKLIAPSSVEKKILELTDWENHILATVRRYMTESNEMLTQIKTLNPPLTTEHLKPFVRAMEKDQLSTIQTLHPISERIDQLVALRTQLKRGRFPVFNYTPAW